MLSMAVSSGTIVDELSYGLVTTNYSLHVEYNRVIFSAFPLLLQPARPYVPNTSFHL